ncbi:cytochrome C oxidase subunit II [Magnetospirillum sp. SS-4]|uniref:cytochrome C oxidase subunit II n=1 Tax=Magnetospirillum sp. SS-4 TaxID=2681465 RepID=UPI0013852030|nr:cytochrome C oxidase subunit II [Magnetospirillum sp. SS-4]CAA7624972.1 Cytochrome-c oxidase subunit II [Magnetospirillum sp. SS-4]
MVQHIAWVITLVAMGAVTIGFLWVAAGAGNFAEYPGIVQKAYRIRKVLFIALLAVSGGVSAATLGDLPYAATHGAESGKFQVIDAVGARWQWELSADRAVVGQPVRFRVTATDVTHGFGIYDESMRLLAQTQAMPGYTNVLTYTFRQAGRYRLLCLEYCGVAHHGMMGEFTVVDR